AATGPTSGVADSRSSRASRRVRTASPSGAGEGSSSRPGGTLVSRPVSARTTNFITWPVVAGSAGRSDPSPRYGTSGPSLTRYSSVPARTPVKSTTTSARSAGASVSRSSSTGLGRNPPSPPTHHSGSAARTGRAAGDAAIERMRVRELQPLSSRNRYRRGSTSSTGQVTPFTGMVVPKNSGTQIGGTSPWGRYAPVAPPASRRSG